MTPLDQLIREARLQLEIIELCHKRNEGKQHAIAAAERLEKIAWEMREGMNEKL